MRIRLAAAYFIISFICLTIGLAQSQANASSVKTLFCQDDNFPEFQYYLDFDESTHTIFGVQSGHITANTIEYTDVIKGVKYKTIIYRSSGRFTVFMSGNVSGNFSGQCIIKPKNIF